MRGIPDDTPENTVRAIALILIEEAKVLGAIITANPEHRDFSDAFEATIKLGNRAFSMFITAVPFRLLETVDGSIGHGHINGSSLPEPFDLELLPKDFGYGRHSPPFRWGLYRDSCNYLTRPPEHILDGTLLRRFLHESLTPQLPPSP